MNILSHYETNYSKLKLFVLDVVCGTVAFILKVIVQSQSMYKNENVFANYVCCHCLTFFCLLFAYRVMSPVSPAAIKKQKQRLWITNEKKKVYREKDKLARGSARQTMSPEKRRLREKKEREHVRLKVPKKLLSKKEGTETQW
jgi:hypothetical protein